MTQKFKIRFNKTRGQPGRGTIDHVWRVFDENGKEWLAKGIVVESAPVRGEKDASGADWNMVCEGEMRVDRETSVITIYDDRVKNA